MHFLLTLAESPAPWYVPTPETATAALRLLLLLLVALPLLYLAANTFGRVATRRFSVHSGMILRKGLFYTGIVILILMTLSELGFSLAPLIGAAGILGIAIGFASQTSLSNIISGLFLVWEKPFYVGDVIKCGEHTGQVFSLDLLSTKLRTFDNRFVRLPNESLIKGDVVNITRFPIRRLDIQLGVAYKEDVRKVINVLLDIANKNPQCLDEPEPIIIFQEFGDSSLNFLFAIWFARQDMLALRNSIMREIKERFDAEGIEIPFPHRTLYTGSVTEPFPIRILNDNGPPPFSGEGPSRG